MKKKLVLAMLTLSISFSLIACSSSEDTSTSQNDSEEEQETSKTEEGTDGAEESKSAGNSSNTENMAAGSNEDIDSVLKKVEVEAVPTQDGLVCMFITNNSDSIIQELKAQINYKDEEGNTIDLDTDGHDVVLPGSTVVSRMSAPDSYADFETEIDIDLDTHPKYENHAADVDIQSNVGEDCIIIEITNNSDVTIEEIEYDVVLYKDGEVLTILHPKDVRDVEPGQTVTEKESTYNKDFDDYEIYLNQAHTFGL